MQLFIQSLDNNGSFNITHSNTFGDISFTFFNLGRINSLGVVLVIVDQIFEDNNQLVLKIGSL